MGASVAMGFGALFNAPVPNFELTFSATSIAAAFLCSTGIGVVFGHLPAHFWIRWRRCRGIGSRYGRTAGVPGGSGAIDD